MEEHEEPEDGKPGAEGGDSDAARKPPPAAAEDDSPLGETDHHSEADADAILVHDRYGRTHEPTR
jgi:hypothetical protein